MPTVKYTPNQKGPARLSPEEEAHLAAMSDEQIAANAAADPDNPPMSDAEWSRGRTRWLTRKAREAAGLSQAKFAEAFHLNVRTVQGWESGRKTADDTAVALLEVIMREPVMVRQVLSRKGEVVG